jgi:hypothetical protein
VVVGVGPIPVSETTSTSESLLASVASQSDTPTNPTYEAIEKAVAGAKTRKKANRGDLALDVWYFVVPVECTEMDAKGTEVMKKVQDTSHEVPLIKSKPDSPFVACRFCLKE